MTLTFILSWLSGGSYLIATILFVIYKHRYRKQIESPDLAHALTNMLASLTSSGAGQEKNAKQMINAHQASKSFFTKTLLLKRISFTLYGFATLLLISILIITNV